MDSLSKADRGEKAKVLNFLSSFILFSGWTIQMFTIVSGHRYRNNKKKSFFKQT